ncbi:MAG: glycosyltransferase [Betaproteobacteria bacterium]|nr:glycosyltransferase [Betaproteobacteria bacterium]
MNVLLLTSPAPRSAAFSTSEKRPPLGVGTLIAVLEQRGHTVFFDDQYLKPWPIFDNAAFVRRHRIDFVGIYSSTICLQGTLSLVRKLQYLRKQGTWGGRIAVGGPHTSYGAESLPEYVDHICIGEGDITLYEFIEGTEKERIVVGKKVTDLDALPMPAWRHFIYRGYNWTSSWNNETPTYTMNTSRGCPFSCAFCSVKGVWGRTYRYMSAERVLEDIVFMSRYYGMRTAYFREDHFTLNVKRMEALCEGLLQRNEKVSWMCESRADSVDRPGVLKLMAKAGCRAIYLGIESGSQRMLDLLKKNETVEQFEYVIAEARRVGIRTYASMIYGVPGETSEDVALTEAFLERTRPDHIGRNVFVGLPGSELYDALRRSGVYDYEDENGLLYPTGYESRARVMYGSEYFNVVSKALGTASPEFPGQIVRSKKKPLISVIMPARNAAAFVAEAVDSILGQTEGNFEYLVLDDASDDDTYDALCSLRDPRIFLHRNKKPLGITPSLNKLLDLAQGDFIARMDADDISLPERFARQVAFMRKHPDIWVCGGPHTYFGAEAERVREVPLEHDEIKSALLFTNPLAHPFVMIRGDRVCKHGIRYDETMTCAQDYELWIRLALRYEARFANIPQLVGRYRKHAGATSTSRHAEQLEMTVKGRLQAFEALGCANSEKDMEAHKYIYQLTPIKTREQMVLLFDWAMQLRSANEERGIFCREPFNTKLLERLLSLSESHTQFADVSHKLLAAWPPT